MYEGNAIALASSGNIHTDKVDVTTYFIFVLMSGMPSEPWWYDDSVMVLPCYIDTMFQGSE